MILVWCVFWLWVFGASGDCVFGRDDFGDDLVYEHYLSDNRLTRTVSGSLLSLALTRVRVRLLISRRLFWRRPYSLDECLHQL